MTYTFTVDGTPAPQGSAKAYVRGGRAVVTHANTKTIPWRERIQACAREVLPDKIPYPRPHPVELGLVFLMPRRASEPKRVTPPHIRKPDLDKLIRAALDALAGLAYEDDSQVTAIHTLKRTCQIGERPGVDIIIERSGT